MAQLLVSAGVALATASLACQTPAPAPEAVPGFGQSPAAASERVLKTQFTYKATVPGIPPGIRVLELWLPIPSNRNGQTVTGVKVNGSFPHKITQEKKYGNRMVYVRAENPTAPLEVSVTFRVDRKEIKSPLPGNSEKDGESELDKYLRADALVPVGGRFGQIAKKVTKGKTTPKEKMRALFEHVVETMQYDYKKESPYLGDGNVPFVCDYKKGNCSDLHSYIISLARSVGIPAVLEYGFPITGVPLAAPLPTEGSIGGYHCWTWFYDPEHGWLPLDASDARRWLDAKRPELKEQLFGGLVPERSAVAFSRGRDLTLEPPQKDGELNYLIYPYAEADGKELKAKWELSYKLVRDEEPSKTSSSPSKADGGVGVTGHLR